MSEFTRNQSESQQFSQRLNNILDARLTPENINVYAEYALTGIIELIQDVTDSFQTVNTTRYGAEQEDAAFSYYGLTNIEQTLDHIQGVANELSKIDQLIEGVPLREEVYVPPDDSEISITPGSGTFTEKTQYPRLKTVLFIMSHDFSLDIHNPEQVVVDPSSVHNNMMRKLGYVLVNAPQLNRAVLVCDEEGNASFVFNTEVFSTHGHNPQSLASLTKTEIRDLFRIQPDGGARLVYDSEYFVPGMRGAIKDPRTVAPFVASPRTNTNIGNDSYLRPNTSSN